MKISRRDISKDVIFDVSVPLSMEKIGSETRPRRFVMLRVTQ